jgi:thioredoxin reductase (NADPH)
VTLVVRADSLDRSMSHYLVRQIEITPNIEVRLGTEVVGGSAGEDGWIQSLVLRSADGETESVASDGLFLLIGAHPNTDWLPAGIERDDGGFVYTGPDVKARGSWPLERSPLTLETAMPGVFAAGDVRHGSMSRVASAVGEGSIAIGLVHECLAAQAEEESWASAAER